MQVKIDGDYYMKSDPYNFILSKYAGQDKEGRHLWDNISYHQKPEQALDSFVNHAVRTSKHTEISELAADIRRLRKVFEEAFNE